MDQDTPDGLSPPLQALWWLRRGGLRMGADWERAHAICQSAEGTPAYDRVHALAHWIEGDAANSAYWYRRSGYPRAEDIESDWAAQVADLGA